MAYTPRITENGDRRVTTDATVRVTESSTPVIDAGCVLDGVATINALGGVVRPGYSIFSGEGTLLASGDITKEASSSLEGIASVYASSDLILASVGIFIGESTLSISGHIFKGGSASFEGDTTLSVNASRVTPANVNLTGGSTLLTEGTRTTRAISVLDGVSTFSVEASRTTFSGVSLSGESTLVSDGEVFKYPALVLQGVGSLTGISHRETFAGVTLLGESSLLNGGVITKEGQASLEGASSLTLAGTINLRGAIFLAGAGVLVSNGYIFKESSVSLEGTSFLSAISNMNSTSTQVQLQGSSQWYAHVNWIGYAAANLSADGGVITAAERTQFPSATLTSESSITAICTLLIPQRGVFEGVSDAVYLETLHANESAEFIASSDLTSSGDRVTLASSILSGSGSQSAAADRLTYASGTFSCEGTLTAIGTSINFDTITFAGDTTLFSSPSLNVIAKTTLVNDGSVILAGERTTWGRSTLSSTSTFLSEAYRTTKAFSTLTTTSSFLNSSVFYMLGHISFEAEGSFAKLPHYTVHMNPPEVEILQGVGTLLPIMGYGYSEFFIGNGTSTLEAKCALQMYNATTLRGNGGTLLVGERTTFARATLSGASYLDPPYADVYIEAFATLTASSDISKPNPATILNGRVSLQGNLIVEPAISNISSFGFTILFGEGSVLARPALLIENWADLEGSGTIQSTVINIAHLSMEFEGVSDILITDTFNPFLEVALQSEGILIPIADVIPFKPNISVKLNGSWTAHTYRVTEDGDVRVTTDQDVRVTEVNSSASNPTIFAKYNGNWMTVAGAYKKISGRWTRIG
jgi:hypothetical protein